MVCARTTFQEYYMLAEWPGIRPITSLLQVQCPSYIQYKVALTTYKALLTSVPSYLDKLLQCQEMMRLLWFIDALIALHLFVPKARTETAE